MARQRSKFPVEKPYVKVERSINSSSSGRVDLSYSYSCIKAFEKNQHIIGELATVHNQAKYKGQSHEPALFTLTGDREKPICHPFYYSTLSERNESSSKLFNTNTSSTDKSQELTDSVAPELTRQLYNQNKLHREHSFRDYHSEYEPEFPDLQVLIQWLKYQFKYINYLWPFTKTNCNFLNNFCKRNKRMKMEILLNNLDEETKLKLKHYVAEMNLSMEERFSLCNESIIEIDISSIVEYPERLQAFLLFLRSIELGNSTEIKNVDYRNIKLKKFTEDLSETKKNEFSKQEHANLFESLNSIDDDVENNANNNRKNNLSNNSFNQILYEKLKDTSYDKCCKPIHSRKFRNGTNTKHSKYYNNNIVEKNENEIANYTLDFEDNTTENHSSYYQSKPLSNKYQMQGHYTNKKTRMNLTAGDVNLGIENTPNTIHHKNILNSSMLYNNRETIDHALGNQPLLKENKYSCKCLIHKTREDYNRYKNQCLFGKGDENSNRFLNYAMNNKKCENNCEKHFDICQLDSARNKNEVCHMEVVNDEYPSVTKLICSKQVKSESKPKIHLKYVPNKFNKSNAKNKLLSSSTSREYDHVNTKLNTNSLTYPNKKDFDNDFNSESGNLMLGRKSNVVECCRFGEEYVEKLVCAVNLSEQSSHSDCLKDLAENNTTIIDTNYDVDECNACFESLDYSINSCSTPNDKNASSKPSIQSSGTKNSNNSAQKLPQDSNNHYIRTRYSTGYKKTANISEVNALRLSGNRSVDYGDEESNHNVDIIPYKYYDKHSECIISNDCNTRVSINKNTKTKKCKVSQNQIHVLIKNANELEKNVIFLNERLSQLNTRKNILNCRQENKYNIEENEHHQLKNRSLLIRINSDGTQQITEQSQTSTNKKHLNLNSLTPRNIYRSISSIFKGNRTKYKEENGNMKNKTSSLECYKSLSKENNHDKGAEIAFTNNGFEECLTPTSSNFCKDESQMLIECLEKLYKQLENQQKEIKEMKQVLDNQQCKMNT